MNIYKITTDLSYNAIFSYPIPTYNNFGSNKEAFQKYIKNLADPGNRTVSVWVDKNGEKHEVEGSQRDAMKEAIKAGNKRNEIKHIQHKYQMVI